MDVLSKDQHELSQSPSIYKGNLKTRAHRLSLICLSNESFKDEN